MTRFARLAVPAVLALACNQPPTTPTVSVGPAEPTTLDDLTVTYEGSTDPNAKDEVAYRVQWFKDGTRQESLADTDSVRAALTRKGEVWRAVVTPWDGKVVGPASEAEVTIVNSPPTATVEISPEEPKTEDRVRATTTRQDVDQDVVSLRYEWVLNGSVTSVTGTELSDQRTSKGQVWELRAIPSDQDGDGEPAVVGFTIANTAPSMTQARIAPELPDRTDTVTCTGVGWEDADEDAPGYDIEWFVNGASVGVQADLPLTDVERNSTVHCIMTPNDGEDTGESVKSPTVIVGNTPPSISAVVIAPDEPTKDDVVVPTIEGGVDLDGDEITYVYSWVVNGSEAGSGPTLPPSRFRKGDSIQLTVRPTDGTSDGEPVSSNVITGGNNLPVIDRAIFDPTEVFTDTVITLDAIASDPDGDSVDLNTVWFVNSTRLTVSGTELDGGTWFERGDEIYATVTPDDGEDTGVAVTTDTYTVQNSLPTEPEMVMDPEDPTPGDKVHCKVDTASTDADDDSLTYTFSWTVNGTTSSSTETTDYTNDTISSGGWSDGDEVVCTVTISDGIDSITIDTPIETYEEFTFEDTSSDDIDQKDLYDFFNGLSGVDTDWYIFVEVDGGSSTTRDGAWCSERADWYVDNYVRYASGRTNLRSGSWKKWSRNIGGGWSSAVTTGYLNYFGSGCDSRAYSWCSEWGVGGKQLGIMPDQPSSGESYAGGWSSGRNWDVIVRVGPRRNDVCGF